ncbi:outer membrane protein assembly factor BamB [Pandoraea sp. XJJ-1]|nr:MULTISPECIES: outer membrane protein assembly factor BamB [unclassified Pandoraea]WAL84557.1 outer membrane protein assembly factor BamB [Pandoraea sp. XJJ-1]BDD94664.1 outer membrane protein assembly factor BamB [Pandoraea sp. NE5]
MMIFNDFRRSMPQTMATSQSVSTRRGIFKRAGSAVTMLAVLGTLGGCGLFGSKPAHEPTPLTEIKQALNVKQIWTASVGKSGAYSFAPVAVGNAVFAAGANGSIVRVDADTGASTWSAKADTNITAGPGSDGETTVVATHKGDVIAFDHDGKSSWKANAGSEVLTAPLVGRGLVVVRAINNRVTAFDAATGSVRWSYSQPTSTLTLRTGTGMTFLGDRAVVTGFPGGKLVALDANTGNPLWVTPLSYPKGVTEVERVNDVTGTPVVFGRQVCGATFQGRVGCADVQTGNGLWARDFSSPNGVTQDERVVAAVNTDGAVYAFNAADGSTLWQNDKLKYRDLSAPLALGRVVVVGDKQGYLHFLSRENGELLARVKLSGAISAQPILAGQTLVVQTRDGNIYGFRPD